MYPITAELKACLREASANGQLPKQTYSVRLEHLPRTYKPAVTVFVLIKTTTTPLYDPKSLFEHLFENKRLLRSQESIQALQATRSFVDDFLNRYVQQRHTLYPQLGHLMVIGHMRTVGYCPDMLEVEKERFIEQFYPPAESDVNHLFKRSCA